MRAARALFTASLACALALGCSRDEQQAPVVCPEVDAGPSVDPALMAFLGKARAAHHIADLKEESKDVPGAVSALTELVKRAKTLPNRPETSEVMADTHARLADLQSQLGRFDAAEASIDEGLGLAKGTTYFLGHLHEVRGLVAERRAKQLRERGDESRAKEQEAEAIRAFEKSMAIQEKVIEQALDAGAKGDAN